MDARRYQPGNISYLTYWSLLESLRLITSLGVERIRDHCVALSRQLIESLDPELRFSISPHIASAPIVTFFTSRRAPDLLREAGMDVSYGDGRLRISPSIHNTEADIEQLCAVLEDRLD